MVQAMNNETLIDGSVMERRDWYGSHEWLDLMNEKEEEPKPKKTRMKIMKIIAETHDIQINKTIRKINETKSCVFF